MQFLRDMMAAVGTKVVYICKPVAQMWDADKETTEEATTKCSAAFSPL